MKNSLQKCRTEKKSLTQASLSPLYFVKQAASYWPSVPHHTNFPGLGGKAPWPPSGYATAYTWGMAQSFKPGFL